MMDAKRRAWFQGLPLSLMASQESPRSCDAGFLAYRPFGSRADLLPCMAIGFIFASSSCFAVQQNKKAHPLTETGPLLPIHVPDVN